MIKNSYFKAGIVFSITALVSLVGFTFAFGYGGGTISSPAPPANVTSMNVPLTISNAQQGTVSQTFSDNSKATVEVPKGAVAGQTTFTINEGMLGTNNAPTETTGAFMVGSRLFNIMAKDIENNEVKNFSGNLTITFIVPALPSDTSSLGVYYFSNSSNEWILVPGAEFDPNTGKATFSINHLTKFAIFKVAGLPSLIKVAGPAETVSKDAGAPAVDSSGKATLEQMTMDANTVASGDVNQIISEMGVVRNLSEELNYDETIVAKIVAGTGVTAEVRNTINNFVTYGTKATKILGAGERAGVVNSFLAAFGRLPTSVFDWNDVIKIANGRWPSQLSEEAENAASATFKKIYLRDPDRSNAHDDAAVTVMAYGLRPANRNLDSEKAAIKIFKNIFGYNPSSATDWDATRAIAYSGATR